MIKDFILKNRSYRRFYQDKLIETSTLIELVDLARLSPSGGNIQSLKYILENTEERNNKIYEHIRWAGYYKDWDGPKDGEKPSAYVVIVQDSSIGIGSPQDQGIAVQSILLGAVEKGLGGCIIGNLDRKNLSETLKLDEKYKIILVLALGYPKEEVVIEEISETGDVKYWRDENEVHHVPKRTLYELILD
ncbi:dihydropteridine reductase [Clostridium puniceum]|uniref:Dihydropteridine reductase n=1 Tax=Clostridium puniceum TaxID=29367 RepID=A0A1S8T1I9_9CLOT|nr:nitroreductase family protein [Clostridium puniceum]OOM71474.1 dihydropteridine reductase [Clostridium puniceum]